jgi:hypothetical protein
MTLNGLINDSLHLPTSSPGSDTTNTITPNSFLHASSETNNSTNTMTLDSLAKDSPLRMIGKGFVAQSGHPLRKAMLSKERMVALIDL